MNASSTTSASHGSASNISEPGGDRLKPVVLGLAVALAAAAGVTDWRSRRIPNWLTVPALWWDRGECRSGRTGGREVCPAGAGLGLLLLLPFVFLRSLGAGDWKLAGALGAFVGPGVLLDLLMGSIFVAGSWPWGW